MKRIIRITFSTLGKKIAFIILAVSVITGGTFIYLAHQTGYQMLEKESESKATAVAGLSEALVQHMMSTGKKNKISHILHTAISFSQIKEASVLKPNGTIAFSADTTKIGSTFDMSRLKHGPNKEDNHFLFVKEQGQLYEYVLDPIQRTPDCIRCHAGSEPILGYVLLKVSSDDLKNNALVHRTSNILMTTLSFGGLGIIIFFALAFFVIRPIRKMHSHIKTVDDQINQLGTGEKTTFATFPELKSNDEVSDLSRAFNNLIKRLNEANSTLYTLHQSELEQADRIATVGEMAASIAHEIKNPIAGVLGALQVFDTEMSQDHPRRDVLNEMIKQLERVNQTINDLLSYARPSPPSFTSVDINELIRKTEYLLSQQFKENKLAIATDLAQENFPVSADKKLIQQLLWNIMLNGLQAMNVSGTLSVRSNSEDASFIIEITDTGNGIPDEIRDRIFKPFYTTKHKGTGLGLAISKRIIDQHHGTMSVVSEVGKGTIVTIVLPSQQPDS